MGGCKSVFNQNQQNADVPLGQNTNCPTCGLFFGKKTSNYAFNQHLDACLIALNPPISKTSLVSLSNIEVENVNLPYKEGNIYGNSRDFVWEKVPKNKEKTEFVWEMKKITALMKTKQILNLPIDQIPTHSFQEKQIWFREKVQKFRIPWTSGADWIQIKRENVLETSIGCLNKINFQKEVKIAIEGDQVNDAGGLLREWMHMVLNELTSKDLNILQKCETADSNYQINPLLDPENQLFTHCFRLLGKIIGKAIFQRIPLNVSFDYTLLKYLTQREVQLTDIKNYDIHLFRTWNYLLDNEIKEEDQLASFIIEVETHQGINFIDLKHPNGASQFVCDQNQKEFVKLSIQEYTFNRIAKYIDLISSGINDVFPVEYLKIFEPHEIDMILNGLPFVNLKDWIANTEYKGAYHQNHAIIKWFWEVLENLDQTELSQFLFYCTGSTRVPLEGFNQLESNRGNFAKFTVLNVPLDKQNPFPKAHTCFNRLELPMYNTKEELQTYLKAITNNNLEGIYGFD